MGYAMGLMSPSSTCLEITLQLKNTNPIFTQIRDRPRNQLIQQARQLRLHHKKAGTVARKVVACVVTVGAARSAGNITIHKQYETGDPCSNNIPFKPGPYVRGNSEKSESDERARVECIMKDVV